MDVLTEVAQTERGKHGRGTQLSAESVESKQEEQRKALKFN